MIQMDKEALSWYSNALEVLGPLRWHLHQLTERMRSHNLYSTALGQPLLPVKEIEEAEAANEAANDFFVDKNPIQRDVEPKITCDWSGFSWVWNYEQQKWLIDVMESGGPPSPHEDSPTKPPFAVMSI
jgi:hypothetical protein